MPRSLYALLVTALCAACSSSSWQTASRASADIAPKPEQLHESIVQIYIARAFSWRKYVATHPWIAWKRRQDSQYSLAQVTGWRTRRGLSAVEVREDIPDRLWFDNRPQIIFSARGRDADRIIDQLPEVIDSYPYADEYRLWPGPNSNTFIEYIIRSIPELTVELPPHSIGKDYLTNGHVFSRSPGGKGVQFSLFGLYGFTLGMAEGLEFNILSLSYGVDVLRPAIKLPFIGRLGMADAPL